MNDRPVWVGIAMKTADGRVLTWQMGEPVQLQISQEFSRYDPSSARTVFRISGGASVWHEGAQAAPGAQPALEAAPVQQPQLKASPVPPCPICGFGEWPEGGMHAARLIHICAHEREGLDVV